MLFNSLHFLVFFPIVTALYFALPHRLRWAHLLLASFYFYMAFIPAYVLILVFTIVVDYFAGLLIAGAAARRRKLYLAASIVANVGVLAFFKYYNFLNQAILDLAGIAGATSPLPFLDIILPIGLSFHTFQAMSYTIEVYRGNQQPERHLGIYALYVMFYPQLVAGPIERPQNLLRQFRQPHVFDSDAARDGLRMMLLGFVKKVVVADRLALVVNDVYGDPTAHSGPVLAFATAMFAVQIYADFSGYSDIARGAARFMGFSLMRNFNHPYLARSIAEFWKRWHISLSTWFRDYFYISLGGNRRGWARWQANLLLTFLLSGLWHGANWTFVIWGGLNGAYLILGNWTAPLRKRAVSAIGLDRLPLLHAACQALLVFVLSCVAWVFFRAASVSDAWHILCSAGDLTQFAPQTVARSFASSGLSSRALPAVLVASSLLVFDGLAEWHPRARAFDVWPTWARWGAYYCGVGAILVAGVLGEAQFIYFQF